MSRAEQIQSKERINWVDILRFLGMSLIYWGHLGISGNTLLYVFAHHVPLFFFISGFFATLSPQEGSFFRFLWKKIRSIVFPYIIFTFLFYILQLAAGELRFSDLPSALLVFVRGIRNEAAGPLWFFTCLFVVSIAFELIKRIIHAILGNKTAKVIVFLIAAGIYAAGICLLKHEPAQDPEWIWNVDSAMVYILYFALGALLFPAIRDWKYRSKRTGGKILFFVFFALSLGFAVFTLLNGETFTQQVSDAFRSLSASAKLQDILFEIYGLLSACILIFFELCIARMLSLIPGLRCFLAYVGKDSLYHCGNELIIKYFGGMLISALGIGMLMQNDWMLLLYSILCLIILTFTLNLLERLAFGRLFGQGRLKK